MADCSEEDIAGAQTYGLGADDRPAVEAFMRGVNSTAGLKFDHPGLAATATRVGPRLTIQNDIGATDAHVIVIAVENSSVIITYTDVHRARARFFTRLTSEFAVQWTGLERTEAKGLGEDNAFYLVVGRFEFRRPRATKRVPDGARGEPGILDRLEQGAQGSARVAADG